MMLLATIIGFVEGGLGLFNFLWSNFVAGLAAVGNFFIGIWNSLMEAVIVPFINMFIEGWNMAGGSAVAIWNVIGGAFQGVWNFMAGIAAGFVNAIIDGVNLMGEVFFNVWMGIKAAFFSVGSIIVQGIESMVNSIIEALNTVLGAVSSIAEQVGITIGQIEKIDLGGAEMAKQAATAGEAKFTPVIPGKVSAKDFGAGAFQAATFKPAEKLNASALNIAKTFDDSTKSWQQAQGQVANVLGSQDVGNAAMNLDSAAKTLFDTPVMSDQTQEGWANLARTFDESGRRQQKTSEKGLGEMAGQLGGAVVGGIKETGIEDPLKNLVSGPRTGRVISAETQAVKGMSEDLADPLLNIEKQNSIDAKRREKPQKVMVDNADEVSPKINTNIAFNQNIDNEKNKRIFILDQTTKSFATTV